MSATSTERNSGADAASTPALLHLSPALPASLSRLGLSFSGAPSPTTPAATTATAASSPSFRVKAIHFDDVAQDAILVCEEGVTLFVPLDCDATTTPTPLSMPPQHGRGKGEGPAAQTTQTHTTTPAAVAACLRLGNPHQAWSLRAFVSPTTLVSSTATATGVEECCVPRRLPLLTAELRRASSVLVAVPVLALPSTAASAAAASSSGESSSSVNVMSIVIVECAVLPEGVDFIEPSAIPLTRPLKKIVCAPNTLRFREAWYSIQLCCWCGPRETLSWGVPSSTNGAAATAATAMKKSNTKAPDKPTHTTDVAEAKVAAAGGQRCEDYHLLCVSSICVDLLRVRRQKACFPGSDFQQEDGSGDGPMHQPDVSTMMNSGYVVPTDRAPLQLPTMSTTRTSSSARSAAAPGIAELDVTLLQRYVTRTDWCAYEPRRRVLLSVNHTRPDVLKPMAVHYEQRCTAAVISGTRAAGRPPPSSSSLSSSLHVSLCTWTELTLPESLCVSVSLPRSLAALSQDQCVTCLLRGVVGIFTAYGHTFIYHVRSPGYARESSSPSLDVYVYLPHNTNGLTSPTPPSSSSHSSCSPAKPGARTTAPQGGAEQTPSPADGDTAASSPFNFFKRMTVAASSATASAAPPQLHSGDYLKIAQLSLHELMPVVPPLPQLSLQVCNNLILLHHPQSGRSAVYDLAERVREEVDAESAGGNLSSRDLLLSVTASERSRQWARTQPLHTTASTPSVAHASLSAGGGGERPAAVSGSFTGRSDRLWSRAVSGDWTSMMSAVAGSVMELSSAVGTFTGSTASATTVTASVPSFAGWQAPKLFPLCCCTATVDLPPADASGVEEYTEVPQSDGEQRDASVTYITRGVEYTSCVWPNSSRISLAINTRDGSLRCCRVDLVALAEWLLLLRTSQQACPASRRPTMARRDGRPARGAVPERESASALALSATTAAALAKASPTSASLRQLIAFACRHPAMDSATHGDGEGGGAGAAVPLLRDLTSHLVLGESRAAELAHREAPPNTSPSYRAVLQPYLFPFTFTSPDALLLNWYAVLEGLTLETEVVARFALWEQQWLLAPAVPGCLPERDFVESSSGLHGHSGGAGHHAVKTKEGMSAHLQAMLVARVWKPVWHDLKHSVNAAVAAAAAAAAENGVSSDTYESHQPTAVPRHQLARQRRRRLERCEELLCEYVRLLRRLALCVHPALQELLLEVVLRCDLDTGCMMMVGDAAVMGRDNDNDDDNSNNNISVTAASIIASANCTARRVRALLRQGVVESSETTAHSLLGWWERFRYQLAAVQQDATDSRQPSHAIEAKSWGMRGEGQADLLSDGAVVNGGDCSEAESLFKETVRLFLRHGQPLKAVEAYRWRHDYMAAAAVLLRLPRDTPTMELCEVHGSRRSSATTSCTTPDASSSCTSTSLCGVAGTAPRCTSRFLSWDTLAVAVLDGAWRAVQEAEEACYVLAESAAAAARSAASPVNSSTTSAESPASPAPPRGAWTLPSTSSTPPAAWQLRAAERAVQVAHRLYLSVATGILTVPGLTTATAAAAASGPQQVPPPSPSTAAVAAADSTTEFNPNLLEAGIRCGGAFHHHRYNPISASVSAGYHAHEVRYLHLRQQVEMDGHHLHSESAV